MTNQEIQLKHIIFPVWCSSKINNKFFIVKCNFFNHNHRNGHIHGFALPLSSTPAKIYKLKKTIAHAHNVTNISNAVIPSNIYSFILFSILDYVLSGVCRSEQIEQCGGAISSIMVLHLNQFLTSLRLL